MARMIDADELLDDITAAEEHGGMGAVIAGTLRRYVIRQPTLTSPNEWVSVEDTVPDPGERVLATDGVFVGEGYINCYGKWCRPNGMKWNMFNEEVTHWMALPKSPKEDE